MMTEWRRPDRNLELMHGYWPFYQSLLFRSADLTRLDGSGFHLMAQRLVVCTPDGTF